MLEELRQRLQALQKPAGIDGDAGVLPLGLGAVDDVLGGGLARGALHEIAAPSEAHFAAATGFALGLACSSSLCARGSKSILWVAEDMALAESGAPYGPGLDGFGVAPENLLTAAVAHRHDLLWAMEEALHCRGIGAAIGELRGGELDAVAMRRLSLAAAQNGAVALLLRTEPAGDISTAATRWIAGASPALDGKDETRFRFAAHLIRNRRGPAGSWILEWSDTDARFILATPAVPVARPALDRPHRKVA
jgi:protein ImuA